MTRTAQDVADRPPVPGECWCCGNIESDNRLVHLGNHPEVVVCVRCAHSLHNWAWAKEDQVKHGPRAQGRNALRGVRRAVMDKGLQRSRFIGTPLRWLGKHVP